MEIIIRNIDEKYFQTKKLVEQMRYPNVLKVWFQILNWQPFCNLKGQ